MGCTAFPFLSVPMVSASCCEACFSPFLSLSLSLPTYLHIYKNLNLSISPLHNCICVYVSVFSLFFDSVVPFPSFAFLLSAISGNFPRFFVSLPSSLLAYENSSFFFFTTTDINSFPLSPLIFLSFPGDIVNIISQSSIVSVLAENKDVIHTVGGMTLHEIGLDQKSEVFSITSVQTAVDAFRLMNSKVGAPGGALDNKGDQSYNLKFLKLTNSPPLSPSLS